MPPELPQSRIKHLVVLMLENRSLDHLFGFFAPPAGQQIENLQRANANLFNRAYRRAWSLWARLWYRLRGMQESRGCEGPQSVTFVNAG